MSLLCSEKGEDIIFGTVLYALTRGDLAVYDAVCAEVIEAIPESAKIFELSGGGADVHAATSSRNFNDSYTIMDFRLGDFLFSVTHEDAERYLPQFAEHRPPKMMGIIQDIVIEAERS